MNSNKSHITKDDFKRYLSDKMTNTERNAFEKELQKNPFEAEALKGFEIFLSLQFDNELSSLEKEIRNKKNKRKFPYFAAAATILLLITSGIIWINLNKQSPLPILTENTVKESTKTELDKKEYTTETKNKEFPEEKEEAIVESEPTLPSSSVTKETNKSELAKNKSTQSKKELTLKKAIKQKQEIQEQQKELHASPAISEEAEATFNIIEAETDYKMAPSPALLSDSVIRRRVKGTVISTEDEQPIAGVHITEKGTQNTVITDTNGNFSLQLKVDSAPIIASFIGMESKEMVLPSDTNNTINLSSEELALEECVVAYGAKCSEEINGSDQSSEQNKIISKAKPVCGYKQYKNYLQQQAILPDNYDKNTTVKLEITIDKTGAIKSIKNKSKSDTTLFNKAKEIVNNGPKWQAQKTQNGATNTIIQLRITFRKK